MKSLLMLFPIFPTVLLAADNIYLRNNMAIINCAVIDTVDDKIIVKTTDKLRRIQLSVVQNIVKSPFLENRPTEYYNGTERTYPDSTKPVVVAPAQPSPVYPMVIHKTTFPNVQLLPLSFVAFALSLEYFGEAGDLRDDAEKIRKIFPQSEDADEYDSRASRKSAYAVIFLVGGLINGIIALVPEKVEIKPGISSLTLSYNF